MEDFKIHCSAIGDIMSGSVGLTDIQEARLNELQQRKDNAGTGGVKPLTPNMENELSGLIQKRDNPELPQGAKSYVKKWFKKYLFGRKEDWKSIVIDKGLACEEDGINLMNHVYGLSVVKNEKFFGNDFMIGTPDIILGDSVRDIKNSWDLFTFPMFDDELPKKEYWWQLQGYMILTGIKKACLDYVLINTPMPLILLDLKKLYFQSGGNADEWNPDKYEELYPNYRFDDIPSDKRIKTFSFDYEPGIEHKIKERVELCRVYLNTLIEKA